MSKLFFAVAVCAAVLTVGHNSTIKVSVVSSGLTLIADGPLPPPDPPDPPSSRSFEV